MLVPIGGTGIRVLDMIAATAVKTSVGHIRSEMGNVAWAGRPSHCWMLHMASSVAGDLEKAYKFYIKLEGGTNLSRCFEAELDGLVKALRVSPEDLLEVVRQAAEFYMASERPEGSDFIYPEQLEGLSITVNELLKLREQYGAQMPKALEEYARLAAIQKTLRPMSRRVVFKDERGEVLINALVVDRVDLLIRLHQAGYSVEKLEGAIEFWKAGDLTVPETDGAVQVADLMSELAALGI